MKNRLLPIMIMFLSFSIGIFAQKRIMIQGVDVITAKKKFSIIPKNSGSGEALQVVPAYCINFFANNKKFTVIDRKNLNLINQEKELQKSEDFMDGYIVDQGKSEGADYALKALYIENEKSLSLKIYDITTSSVKCAKDQKLESNLFGIKNFEKIIYSMLHEMLYDCFEIKFSVVRAIEEKKEKTKSVLAAIGKKSKISLEDRVEIFMMVTEEIDGEQIQRAQVVATGEIDEIQDDNFSVVKIKSGEAEIFKFMKENKKLYCLIKNVFE